MDAKSDLLGHGPGGEEHGGRLAEQVRQAAFKHCHRGMRPVWWRVRVRMVEHPAQNVVGHALDRAVREQGPTDLTAGGKAEGGHGRHRLAIAKPLQ